MTGELIEKILTQLQYNPKEPLMFSSGLFLILFLFLAFFYMLLRGKATWRLLFVTLFSYYFYYKSSGLCFLLLALVTATDFFLGKAIGKARLEAQQKAEGEQQASEGEQQAEVHSTKARWLLGLSILVDLGLLFYFKYTNFFASMISQAINGNFQPWDIVLPVGISFFTFKSLSYTIDVYRGKMKPVESFLDYAFFVSFFPVLVAGPITRATDFMPQIAQLRQKGWQWSSKNLEWSRGVYFVATGLIKKAVISDYISQNFVDRIFDNPTLFSGGEVLLGIYGYCVQIYCDFSGYSDMAIGIALLMGFSIPMNFDAPFKADSMSNFWRRWHISLSSWIRDYIYIPLGGSRKGKVRMYLNQMIAMTLCGLWHGASLNFVVWGGLHGALVCIHKFFSQTILHHDRKYHPAGIRRFFAVLLTFHLVCFTWLFFRCPDFEGVTLMLTQMFTKFNPEVLPDVFVAYKYVFAMILLAFITHALPTSFENRMVRWLQKGGVVAATILMVLVIYLVIQVKSSDVQPFIYFQF